MPGPSRKPKTLKTVSGTVRPCREDLPAIELPPLLETPPAPDWLPNAHAVKEWHRLAPILAANRLLTEGGLSALGTLCALTGRLIQLWTAGELPTGHMLAQYRNLTNDFGLTPVAQGKVRAAAPEQSGNRFAANGKRTA